jgi:hypothetical protein
MSQPSLEEPETTPDVFRPSWGRAWFAAAAAIGTFFVSQKVPLEWYPLNNPGNDINYLEITCAANTTSSTAIYLNLGHGINEMHKIYWPIAPSEMAFTYTFPLWDAPLSELRLDPLDKPGELRITNFRIINRRNEEIVRFTKDNLVPQHEIAAVTPTAEGFTVVTTANATDPFLAVQLGSTIAPVGMNHRNFLRCVLSTSYLAMMLWIILLAVFFAFRRPEPWRKTAASMGFLALLGVLFAFVGNRGLIRNSIAYSRYVAPATPPGLQLELDVVSSAPSVVQLFYDVGLGINETDSVRLNYEAHHGVQTLRFPLPSAPLKSLRFDPRDNEGQLKIRAIRVVDAFRRTRAVLPLASLHAEQQIASASEKDDWLTIDTQPGATDPILTFDQASVGRINQLHTDASRLTAQPPSL